jgi:hypothetical protein
VYLCTLRPGGKLVAVLSTLPGIAGWAVPEQAHQYTSAYRAPGALYNYLSYCLPFIKIARYDNQYRYYNN